MSLIEMNHITYTWLYPQTCPTQMSGQHSNEYIRRNLIGGYYTCEIIRTCEITSTFEITKFTKVTLVLASYNQCVMHTHKGCFQLAWPTCLSSWCTSCAGHEKPSNFFQRKSRVEGCLNQGNLSRNEIYTILHNTWQIDNQQGSIGCWRSRRVCLVN